MSLPLALPYPPMEAEQRAEPAGGPRAGSTSPSGTASAASRFATGSRCGIQSKAGKPLGRYFPDVVEALAGLAARRFVLDGEIVIPVDGRLSFDELLLRVHPAASRVRTLVGAPTGPGSWCSICWWTTAVARLWAGRWPSGASGSRPSPAPLPGPDEHRALAGHATASTRPGLARRRQDGDLDGVVAKRLDLPYRSGERDGMVKVKRRRTADCVVGGFRYASKGGGVGSLLLGLYDGEGTLEHVGFCSSMSAEERGLRKKLERLRQPPGFTGRAPGGPSRWSTERSAQWEPLAPEARRRGGIRSRLERPLPARHQVSPLAAGQGAEAMHMEQRTTTKKREADEAARPRARRRGGRSTAGKRGLAAPPQAHKRRPRRRDGTHADWRTSSRSTPPATFTSI